MMAAGDAAASTANASARELERVLVFGLSVVWFGLVLWRELGASGAAEGTSIVWVARLVASLVAGPLAIKFLYGNEPNKLITTLVVTLAAASSVPSPLKDLGTDARWVVMGLACVIGLDAFLRRPAEFMRLPQLFVLVWAVLASTSALYATDRPDFALNKSISVYFLFGAAMIYVDHRFQSAEQIASALGTLGKITAGFFAANFLLLFSSLGYLGGRYRGITENPNTLGGFFTVTMATMAFVFFQAWRRRGRLSDPQVLLYLGMLVGSIYLLYRSASRGGVLGAFTGVALYLFFAERRLFGVLVAVLAPVLAVVLIAMPPSFEDPEAEALMATQGFHDHFLETSASGRFEAWQIALEKIKERPWLGTGWGTTRFIFERYMRDYAFEKHTGSHVHNSYLELAMELGVPLALGLVAVFVLVALGGVRALAVTVDPERRAVIAALLGSMVGGAVGGIWESWIIAVGSFGAFNLWMVVALLGRARVMSSLAARA